MRTGLVLVGTALALLGAVTVATAVSYNAPTPVTHESTTQSSWTVPALGRMTTPELWGLNGSFAVSWTASSVLDVVLTGTHCPSQPPCDTAPVANWTAQAAGNWQSSGMPAYPYQLAFSNPNHASAAVALTAHSTITTPVPATDVWVPVLSTVAGGVVLAIGAMALFLGLFLRRGVYAVRPPLVSQHADDAETIAGPPPPP
jgi:hypothetical protein